MKCANIVRIKNFLVYRTKIFTKYLCSDHRKKVLKFSLTLDGQIHPAGQPFLSSLHQWFEPNHRNHSESTSQKAARRRCHWSKADIGWVAKRNLKTYLYTWLDLITISTTVLNLHNAQSTQFRGFLKWSLKGKLTS